MNRQTNTMMNNLNLNKMKKQINVKKNKRSERPTKK